MEVRVLLVIFLALSIPITASGAPKEPTPKISRSVATSLEESGKADILIVMKDGTKSTLDQINQQSISSLSVRSASVRQSLQVHTKASQVSILEFLSKANVKARAFWVTNQIHIKDANQELILLLAARDDVSRINSNLHMKIDYTKYKKASNKVEDYAWGVERVRAPEVYSLPGGSNGTGIRVAVIDTGARVTHQDLVDNYIGLNGWYDPQFHFEEPFDYWGHGTHVTGTILGGGGIGVAPGAKFLACSACLTLICQVSHFIDCGQWVICPTLPDGTSSPDCNKTPHIVSNSWGFTLSMNEGNEFYDEVLDAWRTVGIIPVFGQGNEGDKGCESGRYPGDSARVIGIGATSINNTLADFSSRGPSMFGGIKPNVVAPGVDIRSAGNSADNEYAEMSGTSMATPHAAGVVALLLGIQQSLTFEQISTILYKGATQDVVPPGDNCGGVGEHIWPNNAIGHGLLNALYSAKLVIGNK